MNEIRRQRGFTDVLRPLPPVFLLCADPRLGEGGLDLVGADVEGYDPGPGQAVDLPGEHRSGCDKHDQELPRKEPGEPS